MFKYVDIEKHALYRHAFTLILSVFLALADDAVAQSSDFEFIDEVNNTRYIGKWGGYSGSRNPVASYNGNNNGFGRIFRPAHIRGLSTGKLRRLSESMREGASGNYSRRHEGETPAGYTFFGQFIDHDITLDTRSMLNQVAADGDLVNVRTPALDLDSVYGGGPRETPFLYNLPYLRVGKRIIGRGNRARFDMLRTRSSSKHGPLGGTSRALIGDPRNDENFILAQLHTAFISFHNHLADILVERHHGHLRRRYCRRYRECSTRYLAGKLSKKNQIKVFEKARDHVIHYYHRIIAEDFLPRIIGEHRTFEMLVNKRRFFFPNGFRKRNNSLENIYIPLEFSTAAFRFGHSQVSDRYQIRRGVFSNILSIAVQAHKPLKRKLMVDWRYFFPINRKMRGMNRARKIDTKIVGSLYNLGHSGAVEGTRVTSLPLRNLIRGRVMRIPSGQYVASRMLPEIIGGNHLTSNVRYHGNGNRWQPGLVAPGRRARAILGNAETPLWYYILKEAETYGMPWQSTGRSHQFSRRHNPRYEGRSYRGRQPKLGYTLGPVGGTIVGEVLIGLMEHYDRKSGHKGLKYRPEIKAGSGTRGYAPLSLTYMRHGRIKRYRYMMRNLLIDSGLARLPGRR